MKIKLALSAAVAALAIGSVGQAHADPIPYATPGTYNATTYTFTAQNDGELTGYFVGADADYNDEVGVLVNGVQSASGFGLDNQTSKTGSSFDFGQVKSGDTLTFVLDILSINQKVYSDPSMNAAFDQDTIQGFNHVYSTAYTATSPVFAGVPAGTYVGFEDEPYFESDLDYNDEQFVFTDTKVTSAAPEPGAWALMIAGVGMIGLTFRQAKRKQGLSLTA